jgi:murein DD-endopeptidase MepM/ murein hydrolase activator NlpD
MIRLPALILSLATALSAAPLDLRLPTDNRHLFTGELDKFYMYVDRIFEGETSQPWEAGSFGYVRTAMRVKGEVVLTKFHEGIDISPVKRDKAGNPLDLVSSIADGHVVHVSPIAGRSNYGKYVVVEHPWENSAVLSLYAHLAEITCQVGDPVKAGSVLGRMGYTGAGINRTRAHLHLELGMLTSSRYADWHRTMGGGVNYHGAYNGMNIIGTDVARFFLEHKENPERKFSEFVASTPVYFKVAVPLTETPEFAVRYPWIVSGSAEPAVSWEISFSATGQPVAFSPSQRAVTAPTVTAVRPSTIPHRHLTRGLLTGEGNRAELTSDGKKLVALISGDFPSSSPAPSPDVNPR